MSRGLLSSHVLDTSTGAPAAGLRVELHEGAVAAGLHEGAVAAGLHEGAVAGALRHAATTDNDGRVHFPFTKDTMPAGTYRLMFNTGDYYRTVHKETLYPFVEIIFTTKEDQHYHIPLLLSPYGYSTYRGS